MAVLEARRAAKSPWVERAGRLGLVAKGVIYGLVAGLALAIPLGLGGKVSDKQGALRTVAAQSYGEFLLIALAVGFAGYAIWRFVEAFLDRGDEGTGAKAIAKRIGYLGRGLFYTGSCFVAISLVTGVGAGGADEKEETSKVLDWPLGRWIVGAVGAGILVAGVYNLYRSATKTFRDDLREHEMSPDVRSWAIAVGVVGHAARGVVFGLVGIFLLKAAVEFDPKEAIGIDGALLKLARQDYGEWLLGFVAAGLGAYALFCFVQARYREV